MSRRREFPCPVDDCGANAGKSGYCEVHSHDWVAAAEVPIDNGHVAGAVRRAAVTLKEQTWVKVLDVYCLEGSQRFLTRDGLRSFEETAGTTQMVLSAPCRDGRLKETRQGTWVEAEIRSFGEQPLLRVTLVRSGVRRTIRATPEHLWFAGDDGKGTYQRRTTADLRPGMVLAGIAPRDNLRTSSPSPFGIAAGIVYGDGSRANLRGRSNGAAVDLWGEKNEALLPYFNNAPTSRIKIAKSGLLGTRVTGLPAAFKDRPSLDEGVSYLYGWLAGYFAADGCVGADGGVTLASARLEDLEFAATVASRLGIVTLGTRTAMRSGFDRPPTELHTLRFARGFALRPEFFLLREHRERFVSRTVRNTRIRWHVESVEDHGDVDEVFCAVVPEYETFTLEGNLWTHNCASCRTPFGDARNTPCDSYSPVLRGGPLGTRKKREDEDPAAATA